MTTPEPENTGHGRKESDDFIAIALAAGCSRSIAARAGNVSDSTVDRRLKSRKFRRLVMRYRTRMIGEACGRVVDGMVGAADRLRQLVNSPDEKVALVASRALLAEGRHLFDSVETKHTIEELQDSIHEIKKLQNGGDSGHGGGRSSN